MCAHLPHFCLVWQVAKLHELVVGPTEDVVTEADIMEERTKSQQSISREKVSGCLYMLTRPMYHRDSCVMHLKQMSVDMFTIHIYSEGLLVTEMLNHHHHSGLQNVDMGHPMLSKGANNVQQI